MKLRKIYYLSLSLSLSRPEGISFYVIKTLDKLNRTQKDYMHLYLIDFNV